MLKSDSLLESLEGCFGNQCLNREVFFLLKEEHREVREEREEGREGKRMREREREREREQMNENQHHSLHYMYVL